MPVINLQAEKLAGFLGKPVSVEELTKWLPWLGFDLEEVGKDYIKVEYNPNRMDFCSHVGVARALKGFLELETGMPKYQAEPPKVTLNIDSSVSSVRPYMLAAVVRDIKLDEDAIIELMEMQEDLHWGIGRNRRKASIGIHNLDAVEPPFTYMAVEPTSVKFVPLGKTEEMTPKEILEKHEKGIAYRHLIDWAPRYPLLVDRYGRVLSMPPIINGELTRVDEKTRNLFLDVTGPSIEAVERSLKILATTLADMGGRLEKVTIHYPDRTLISPNLEPEIMRLRVSYANKILGLKLSMKEAAYCLQKCRLEAKPVENDVLEVAIPPYRVDIMHEIDLVEEVAIGYGYYRLEPTIPTAITIGEKHPANRLSEIVRQIMTGLGFLEVMNFTLTNERIHYNFMRLKPKKPVRLANPVSAEYTIIRETLLPGLLKNLAENKHETYPQKLFEVSDVVKVDRRLETMCERRLHLAAVTCHSAANYTEIRSVCDAFLTNMRVEGWYIREAKHPSFLEGRTAAIQVGRKQVGVLGEIHPEVLNNFEVENPTAALEIDLEWLIHRKA